jgi:hypothetical protein
MFLDLTYMDAAHSVICATRPDGTKRVFDRHDGELWEDATAGRLGAIADYTPPPPTARDVNAERDRRIAAGFEFNGKLYDFDPDSKARIAGAATLAGFAKEAGALAGNYHWHGGADEFRWLASDNTETPMDAETMFSFGQAAAEFERNLIFKARMLKDADPIPADYADDSRWA